MTLRVEGLSFEPSTATLPLGMLLFDICLLERAENRSPSVCRVLCDQPSTADTLSAAANSIQ
jgi:hypothetical protein